jgi:hypothetical protein
VAYANAIEFSADEVEIFDEVGTGFVGGRAVWKEKVAYFACIAHEYGYRTRGL